MGLAKQDRIPATLGRWVRGSLGRAASSGRWPLIRILPRASLSLTLGVCAVVALDAAAIGAFIVATGRLVGAVPAAVGAGFNSPATDQLFKSALLAVGIFVFEQFLNPFYTLFVEALGQRVEDYLRRSTMRLCLQTRTIDQLENPKNADLISLARGLGMNQYGPAGAVRGLVGVASAQLTMVVGGVLVATFSIPLALILLATGIVGRRILLQAMLRSLQVITQQTQVLRRADYFRSLALGRGPAREIRVFGLADWILSKFGSHWHSSMQRLWKRRRTVVAAVFVAVPYTLVIAIAYQMIGSAALGRSLDLAEMAVLLQAVTVAAQLSMGGQVWRLEYGSLGISSVERLRVLVQEPAALTSSKPPPKRSAIRLDNVSFKYPTASDFALKNVTLNIPAGSALGLVGPNGAGKTTLIKLIASLYPPTDGAIKIGSFDLEDLSPSEWRKQLSIVFQDFTRFPLSVRENVAVGAPNLADDDELLSSVARRAGADRIIQKLPLGWDTILSPEYQGGVDLSGGEWQRIGIARALFSLAAGAQVLIADEPAANLDPNAEAALYRELSSLAGEATLILVSHRIAAIHDLPRVCVLDRTLVQEGKPSELLNSQGLYRELFLLQQDFQRDEEVS